MILVGANREKINVMSMKRRYWPKFKQKKQKRKCKIVGSRMYYEMQLEKYRIINQQLYSQFCVEREFNNQMYREEAQRKRETQKLIRRLSDINDVLDDWTSVAVDDEQTRCASEGSYLHRLLSIIET